MDFTVRLILGTILVLLCSWSIGTAQLHRPVRQTSNNDSKTVDKLQKIEAENVTQPSTVANLTEDTTKPKTEFSTEVNKSLDKENSVVGKLQKSESYKKVAEIARSIDVGKYVSEEFHDKNNVYSLSTSPDTKKYVDPDFAVHATTHKHVDYSQEFDYHSELTTPKASFFDARFKEAVESVEQKLEHIDDSHELSSEFESKENITLEKLYEETKKNDTKSDLNFTNYKNIISNDTGSKNSLHKDLVVEGGTNLEFRSSFNQTTLIDDNDHGNNTIIKEPEEKKVETSTLSNVIPAKGDLDSAESSTSKNVILTTRKSITLTKPPSNKNTSHISILSNNIETETVKAINPLHLNLQTSTEKSKGETESVPEVLLRKTSIDVVKRPDLFGDVQVSTLDNNHIHKKQEQMQQENQIVPVHVEPPLFMKNQTTVTPLYAKMHEIHEASSESVNFLDQMEKETTQSLPHVEISSERAIPMEQINVQITKIPPKVKSITEKIVENIETTTQMQRHSIGATEKNATTTTDEEILTTDVFVKEENISPTTLKEVETPEKEVEMQTELTTESTTAQTEAEPTIASKLAIIRVSSSKPKTTTLTQREKSTARLLDILTTICTPKLEITSVKPESTTTSWYETEVETVTSIVTETSVSPWIVATTEATEAETKTISSLEHETEITTSAETDTVTETEPETTTTSSTYLSDGTAATIAATENPTTVKEITNTSSEPVTTEATSIENSEVDPQNVTVTTESSVRSSKAIVYKEISAPTTSATTTTVEAITTKQPEITTVLLTTETFVEATNQETTQAKVEEVETTTTFVHRILPDFKSITPTDSPNNADNSTDNNTITSELYEHTDPPEDNSGTIAAITISSIGAVCLILLAGLLVIMRKRQKRFNYGQRCRPVSLDDYSMDNVSVANNSVRRKGMIRGSKRSYGNPAFEDPASVSHPLNFPALGKFATNLEDIKAEFEEIPQITARTNELPEGCDTKNRYANVIPLPETRVFLSLIDGYPNSDYINANYVTGPKNIKGYYIACQAPLQNTVDDFWRMIWEQQTKVILMLTHLFENGVEKCVDYLPPSEVLDCHRLFGDFQITLKKREVKDKYIISSLQLKNMVSNSWREVTHFWYLGWPEKGVPSEANSLIAFLIEARSYMKSSSLDRKDVTNGNLSNGMAKNELNPVVVHCSPGTGRTGVVIACDIAIREFEQTRLVDVPRIVYKIRRDRASAVQTKDQYAFIYRVISLYATKLTGGALDSL